ncbi:MAG: glutamate--tRNA ligase [Acidobacteriota bacterium]
MTTRVRFAPSPTGYLHIGGARTALFNWLYARRHQGTFILRIEDTDVKRSSREMVEGILDGLKWLGLEWNEGPFYQSQRLDLYRSVCEQLRRDGHAYHSGDPAALRFRVPENQRVSFHDRAFGPIEVASENIEDFVLLRSDGMPTYHLSVVADDIDMKISHVIRGADHLSNTSKHVLLYQALQQPVPEYVHLPLILGPDKKRLSKRHGATSVLEYRKQGFLPVALRNYLALLGWSPGGDEEIMSEERLIALFDLERINKANAVFDLQKLEWLNGQSISASPAEDLVEPVSSVLQDEGLWNPSLLETERASFLGALHLLKPRVRRLTDFAEWKAFFTDDFEYEPETESKYLSDGQQNAELIQAIQELRRSYQELSPFNLATTEEQLRQIVARRDLKAGHLMGVVRLALTGKAAAPGLFEIVTTLGREKTIQRLERLLVRLAAGPSDE